MVRNWWYLGEVAGTALSHAGLGSILAGRGGAFLRWMGEVVVVVSCDSDTADVVDGGGEEVNS